MIDRGHRPPDAERTERRPWQRGVDAEGAAAAADQAAADADHAAAQVRAGAAADRDATATTRDEEADPGTARERAIDGSLALLDGPLVEELEQVRAQAAADRARAARDRARAAAERADAARERARLEAELHRAHLDDLTGSFRREIGMLTMRHEIERARRADGRFVVAFVDVDGLKGINDEQGHAAGDRALRALVSTMRSHLRSFDPIVRYGGDEFVCGLGGADLDEVERRFELIRRSVRDSAGVEISVGLAALAPHETLDQLTARADAALLEIRKRRARSRPRRRPPSGQWRGAAGPRRSAGRAR